MIYKKDANFPYPVFASNVKTYLKNEFLIDLDINEDEKNFIFKFTEFEIESDFIKQMREENKIQFILIIQSKDNWFTKLTSTNDEIKVPKNRLSLNNRTLIQVHIQALESINFKGNEDLIPFYDAFKEEITVQKNGLIGYSNVLVLEGRFRKPLEIFSKRVDQNLSSEIKIELGNETIELVFKDADYQFGELPKSSGLMLPYIYMGMQKALYQFIKNYGTEDSVELEYLDEPENLLDLKIFNLMRNKNVDELSIDNVDEVINQISDSMIGKYASTVREFASDGN
ncbi:hypothetical protein [Kurthia zopfii]|uniref:hypothetical protein n=1 Tax=Kurthia zopfii TaxID=1650 RepID=UPI000F6E4B16|nr:hypothetical protein [Kurthia zopfii]VEI08521.1 Uncharacterised protein [Kurthia zopfii]